MSETPGSCSFSMETAGKAEVSFSATVLQSANDKRIPRLLGDGGIFFIYNKCTDVLLRHAGVHIYTYIYEIFISQFLFKMHFISNPAEHTLQLGDITV